MKKKNTRRALIMSALSLFMCIVMFAGTTFAWFTDSVTSGKNQIIAGNLDIVLEMKDANGNWVNVDSNTVIPFVAADGRDNSLILWEPGCTYKMADLRVRNVGSLSAMVLVTISGIEGDSELLDVIDFTTGLSELDPVLENALISGGLDSGARDGCATITPIYGTPDGTVLWDESLMPKGEVSNNGLNDTSSILTLSGHMFEEAGNEYMNKKVEGIYVSVVAKQTTWEKDSFGNTYDKNATYSKPVNTFSDLKNALKSGGNYSLTSDITVTDKSEFFYSSYVTAIYADTVLDLNGHTITIDVDMGSTTKAPVLFYVYKEGASLTVVGEGDVIAKHDAFIFFPRSVSDGAYIYGGNYYNNDDTSGLHNDINAIGYSQSGKIEVYGGTYTFKNVNGHCGAFNVYDNSGAEIVLHEGVLLSDSSYYKGSDGDEIHLADGCTLQQVVIDGVTWYKVVKA